MNDLRAQVKKAVRHFWRTRTRQAKQQGAACLLLSTKKDGAGGQYREPNAELSFESFATSFLARAIAFSKTRGSDD